MLRVWQEREREQRATAVKQQTGFPLTLDFWLSPCVIRTLFCCSFNLSKYCQLPLTFLQAVPIWRALAVIDGRTAGRRNFVHYCRQHRSDRQLVLALNLISFIAVFLVESLFSLVSISRNIFLSSRLSSLSWCASPVCVFVSFLMLLQSSQCLWFACRLFIPIIQYLSYFTTSLFMFDSLVLWVKNLPVHLSHGHGRSSQVHCILGYNFSCSVCCN